MNKSVIISGINFLLEGCKELTRKNFDAAFGNEDVNNKPKGFYSKGLKKGETPRIRLNQTALDRTWETLQHELGRKVVESEAIKEEKKATNETLKEEKEYKEPKKSKKKKPKKKK